ncbi:Golgi to ER traffic protein 4 [Erysiphe necator]|uniref:Putative duf410 domain protein n=1 Tax=Uncinula necator TaxID=52586 RepID=A0A0B1P9W2_UNCNE|nr:Golgi to ER traffic protein 4 [Erysiphe necator]KHJ33444.1 putative duf410 domain protein [Erysiphe necator]
MSAKILKTVARIQDEIKEGQFYEAQQQTRLVAARYTKSKDWNSAIDILFNVAKSLLEAKKGGSGGDLCLMLIEVYIQAELSPDSDNKAKLVTLLHLFDSDEPTRKKFVGAMIGWSVKFGPFPAGDPELHHIVGSIYADELDVYEAERHLTLGTKDSPEILAKLEYKWYSDNESHTAAQYAARAVFPYLLAGNIRDADRSLQVFLSNLTTTNKSVPVQSISSNNADVQIFPSIPLLNFLSLLILVIQKSNPNIFRQLVDRYLIQIKELRIWDDTLTRLGELYFGIERPRQGNPLMDILGGFFGGAAPNVTKPKRIGAVEIPKPSEVPTADDLD